VATPEVLSAAIRVAYALLERDGDLVRDEQEHIVPMNGQPSGIGTNPGAERILNELMKKAAQGRDVPSVRIYFLATGTRAAHARSRG
jgi:phosphatidylserine/phosphatidylglycerophosphate/cardiolipin synthase-like enzyme